MNELNNKLEKIKKSCKAGCIVSRIVMIMCIVGCTLTLISGIVIFNMGSRFDSLLAESSQTEAAGTKILSAHAFGIDLSDFSDVESDIPALQAAIDDHPASISAGLFLVTVSFFTALCAVFTFILAGTFRLIETSETPFTVKIRNRIVICLVGVAFLLGGIHNLSSAAVTAIAAWAVYTIMDYGIALQTESDETL